MIKLEGVLKKVFGLSPFMSFGACCSTLFHSECSYSLHFWWRPQKFTISLSKIPSWELCHIPVNKQACSPKVGSTFPFQMAELPSCFFFHGGWLLLTTYIRPSNLRRDGLGPPWSLKFRSNLSVGSHCYRPLAIGRCCVLCFDKFASLWDPCLGRFTWKHTWQLRGGGGLPPKWPLVINELLYPPKKI